MTGEENNWECLAESVQNAIQQELDGDPDQLTDRLADEIADRWTPIYDCDLLDTAARRIELAHANPNLDTRDPIAHIRANITDGLRTVARAAIDAWEEEHEEEHES